MQIVERLADALDLDDFDALEQLLEPEACYDTNEHTVRGAPAIVETFRRNSAWGRSHIDSVTFCHSIDADRPMRIIFTDVLRHGDETFVHTMTMDVRLSVRGLVAGLVLAYPAGEMTRLNAFFRRIGIGG
jgi:hypothetical protein